MDSFEFILTSYDGHDDFLVEIWYQNSLIAIVKDTGELQLLDENNSIVSSGLFDSAIKIAKRKLDDT